MSTMRHQLQSFIRSNGYAWPGGYPCALLLADGGVIDAQSARENYRLLRRSTGMDWTPISVFINWEDDDLHCDHSGRKIQSAYGGNDEDQT